MRKTRDPGILGRGPGDFREGIREFWEGFGNFENEVPGIPKGFRIPQTPPRRAGRAREFREWGKERPGNFGKGIQEIRERVPKFLGKRSRNFGKDLGIWGGILGTPKGSQNGGKKSREFREESKERNFSGDLCGRSRNFLGMPQEFGAGFRNAGKGPRGSLPGIPGARPSPGVRSWPRRHFRLT